MEDCEEIVNNKSFHAARFAACELVVVRQRKEL
jgi:hypothetical protein